MTDMTAVSLESLESLESQPVNPSQHFFPEKMGQRVSRELGKLW